MSLRTNLLITALSMQLFVFNCARQVGTVAGIVNPAVKGVRIAALQNGKIISSVEAGMDGKFSMTLAQGTYDISVSAPASPFPMVFHAVDVQQGKNTYLSHIDLPLNSTVKGALSGRVSPALAGTTVALFVEGKEQASVNTDNEGEFIFRELLAGTYTLQARAPGYAPDTVAVTVSPERPTTHNLCLFYVSAIEGVDWAAGKIRASGIGLPPANAAGVTISREMARRAALADAERKLLKAVIEIKLGPVESLGSRMREKKFSRKIEGFIKGYKVARERELDAGRIETDLELPLTGVNGLTQYVVESESRSQ